MHWRASVCTALFASAGLGCGGGEGSVGATNLNGEEPAPSLEPARPARGIDVPGVGGTSNVGGTSSVGGTNSAGGTNSGAGGTTSGPLTCSGSYNCEGNPATLSQAADGCRVTLADGTFTLASDGSVLYEGYAVGTWSGSSESLQICVGACATCTPS